MYPKNNENWKTEQKLRLRFFSVKSSNHIPVGESAFFTIRTLWRAFYSASPCPDKRTAIRVYVVKIRDDWWRRAWEIYISSIYIPNCSNKHSNHFTSAEHTKYSILRPLGIKKEGWRTVKNRDIQEAEFGHVQGQDGSSKSVLSGFPPRTQYWDPHRFVYWIPTVAELRYLLQTEHHGWRMNALQKMRWCALTGTFLMISCGYACNGIEFQWCFPDHNANRSWVLEHVPCTGLLLIAYVD